MALIAVRAAAATGRRARTAAPHPADQALACAWCERQRRGAAPADPTRRRTSPAARATGERAGSVMDYGCSRVDCSATGFVQAPDEVDVLHAAPARPSVWSNASTDEQRGTGQVADALKADTCRSAPRSSDEPALRITRVHQPDERIRRRGRARSDQRARHRDRCRQTPSACTSKCGVRNSTIGGDQAAPALAPLPGRCRVRGAAQHRDRRRAGVVTSRVAAVRSSGSTHPPNCGVTTVTSAGVRRGAPGRHGMDRATVEEPFAERRRFDSSPC